MNELKYFSDIEFSNMNYVKELFTPGEYESCKFIKCSFASVKFLESIFINCDFVNCDLTGSNISATVFRDVMYDGCLLNNLQFDTCNQLLLSFAFEGCKINRASFFGMKLHKTKFTKCELIETDFGNADLTGSIFDESDLRNTIFDNTNLSKCDFHKAYNYLIDPENNKIVKAKFSSAGLSGLLTKYDITIE